jgi:hypothetical protein
MSWMLLMSINISSDVSSHTHRCPSRRHSRPILCMLYRCGRLIPVYLVGPKTTFQEVLQLKCSFESVVESAGDCICSHS